MNLNQILNIFYFSSQPKEEGEEGSHANLESLTTCLDLTCQTAMNNEDEAQITNTYFLSV